MRSVTVYNVLTTGPACSTGVATPQLLRVVVCVSSGEGHATCSSHVGGWLRMGEANDFEIEVLNVFPSAHLDIVF